MKAPEIFCCLECGKKFKTVSAARKASYDGCPKCGGVDIGIYVPKTSAGEKKSPAPK